MDEHQRRLLDNSHPGDDQIVNGRRQAAVLVIIYEGKRGELRTILTVRSHNLTHHPGEVALPGGRCEAQDLSLIDTAFREAEEEIGVDRKDLKVLTILPALVSRISNFIVTPVVVRLLPSTTTNRYFSGPFNYNPEEVSTVFTVPLRKFIVRNSCYSFYLLPEDEYPLHSVRHAKYRVMGLTCNILVHTASIAYGIPPEFPFKYPLVDDQKVSKSPK